MNEMDAGGKEIQNY